MTESKFSLLLVDDDKELRETYAEIFQQAGFTVSQAEDGLQALEMVSVARPDVIFTGIIMPRMDGFAFFEALKKNVATAAIPVVFSSHLGRREDEEKARALGGKDFIVRGVTPPTETVARVRAVLAGGEYIIAIDPTQYDARKMASDLGLHPEFLSTSGQGERLALRLRVRDIKEKTFDAQIIPV